MVWKENLEALLQFLEKAQQGNYGSYQLLLVPSRGHLPMVWKENLEALLQFLEKAQQGNENGPSHSIGEKRSLRSFT